MLIRPGMIVNTVWGPLKAFTKQDLPTKITHVARWDRLTDEEIIKKSARKSQISFINWERWCLTKDLTGRWDITEHEMALVRVSDLEPEVNQWGEVSL